MPVPFTFGTATTSIPLSNLDANFNTPVTIGNTTVGLGNTVTTLGNVTLTNATISSGNVTVSNVTDSALTSGRVTYAGTGGLLQDSANLTFNGTTLTTANDASISGLTVGKGGGANSTAVVLGNGALAATNTGNYNIAIGTAALAVNTSGTYNIALGGYSLPVNTTGNFNTALGTSTMQANTTGANNTAVGVSALLNNTTASQNTAVGYQAGYSLTTGGFNTMLGYQAGYYNTLGQYNTFVGHVAGVNANPATLSNTLNTFIGYASGYNVTTGTRNTILGCYNGNQGGLDIRTSSNYIVLSDGDGNPRGVINPSGFLKVAASGSIFGTTGAYHEFNSSSGDTMLRLTQSSATPFGVVIDYTGAAPNANSNAYLTCQDNSGGGRVTVRIWSNGNMQNLNNSYGSLSDQAIKENIVDATPKLADLMQVKIRNFNLIGDETKQIGVVAQELETVFPSMVESTEDGFKGVKYSVFVPMLIKAVQELNAKVEAQALEIAQLKGN